MPKLKTEALIAELEEAASQLGLKVIYEKGDFGGGYCILKEEKLIVIMYYYEGLTMREIGDILSLTESRVCQLHSQSIARLRSKRRAH